MLVVNYKEKTSQDSGLMDLIIIVVAIGVLISLVVLMFRYAGFIHQGPSSGKPDENREKDETEDPPNNSQE